MRSFLSVLLVLFVLLVPLAPVGSEAPPFVRILLATDPDYPAITAQAPWQVLFPSSQASVALDTSESTNLGSLFAGTWIWLQTGSWSKLEEAARSRSALWQQLGKPTLGELDGAAALTLGPYKERSQATERLSRAQEEFPEARIAPSDAAVYLELADRPYDLGWGSSQGGIALRLTSASPLFFEGKPYRGSLEIFYKAEGSPSLRVVNFLDMESYLYGVVPSEITYSWHPEALKAQAVAARTYALRKLTTANRAISEGYDLTATVSDQAYKGYAAEKSETNLAVDATRGQVLTYAGELIGAFFHSSSGGYTENNEIVWKGSPYPYLRGVPSPGEEGSAYTNWTVTISAADFLQAIRDKKGASLGSLLEVRVLARGVSGRIKTLQVSGSENTITLTGEELRQVADLRSSLASLEGAVPATPATPASGEPSESVLVGASWFLQSRDGMVEKSLGDATLHSSAGSAKLPEHLVLLGSSGLGFLENLPVPAAVPVLQNDMLVNPDSLTFVGHGWGHGVGMPQWGAKARAEEGKDYRTILTYYYTGVLLENRYP